MESKCGSCDAPYDLERLEHRPGIGMCWKCDASLAETRSVAVDRRDPGVVAIVNMVAVLAGEGELVGLSTPPQDLFNTLNFIACFLVNTETNLGNGSHTWGRYAIQRNEAYCLSVIGRIWTMLANKRQFAGFIKDNQKHFNVRVVNSKNVPDSLLRYVERTRPRRIEWSKLRPIALRIAGEGRVVTSNDLARATGLKLQTIRKKAPPELWQYLSYLNSRTFERLLKNVEMYVMSIKVCDFVKKHDAAIAVGWPYHSLMGLIHRRPEFNGLFAEADERRRDYYLSLSCPKCYAIGAREARTLRGVQVPHTGKRSRAIVVCSRCDSTSTIDVSNAPTHREFLADPSKGDSSDI